MPALVTGGIHAGLALEAARLAMGMRPHAGGSDQRAAHWTALVLQHRHGALVIGSVGIGFAVYGVYQLVRAWRAKLDRMLRLRQLDPGVRRWATRIARFGMAARGLVFATIGIFLIRAALHYSPGEARGLAGAQRAFQQQAYGAWVLAVVALGLMAYGGYELLRARYRMIPTEPMAEQGTRIRVRRSN